MSQPLRKETTNGPVLGFPDTFTDLEKSSASRVLAGEDGGHTPIASWLGIPYGQAERWKRCVAPKAWTEPFECFDFCARFPAWVEDTNGEVLFGNHGIPNRAASKPAHEQDAFQVNVYAPGDVNEDEKLPVLAWIHGGGLTFGTSFETCYDPRNFLRKQLAKGRRFVLVSGNYRCNLLGFMSCRDLEEEECGESAGNWGVYDTAFWLQWVQDNIAAFGGDPSNVTIYGESAGSVLCAALCLHPDKLFKRAICQSGGLNSLVRSLTGFDRGMRSAQPPVSRQEADVYYQTVLRCHGITTKTHPTAASRIGALRAISYDTLAKAFESLPRFFSSIVIERGPRAIYTDHPITLIRQGKINSAVQAVLIGVMGNEGGLFPQAVKHLTDVPHEIWLKPLPPASASQVREHFVGGDHNKDSREAWSKVDAASFLGNAIIYGAVEEMLDAFYQGRSKSMAPIRFYQIDTPMSKVDEMYGIGACHSTSLSYLFDLEQMWDGDESAPEAKTTAGVAEMIARFAIDGSVDSDWPAWSRDKPLAKTWSAKGDASVRPQIADADRLVWKRAYETMTARLKHSDTIV